MNVEVLKSKLQRVIITQANLEYKGSLTLDPDLMDAANFLPWEKVEVNNSTSGSRIATYIIPGKRGSGEVCLNGGAALHGNVGDQVHVLSYCTLPLREAVGHKPLIVVTDENNRYVSEL
jgi:aspartate 1-decarboxylase